MPRKETASLLSATYGAYGQSAPPSRASTRYAGERIERDTGWYLLGPREYSPGLRRFLAPDARSPFEDGGTNRYAYGGGDPMNRIDPTGESWVDWILPAVSIAFAAAAVVASAGVLSAMVVPAAGAAAAAFTPGLVAATAAAAADVVGLAATIGSTVTMATKNRKLNEVFGWTALGAGLVSGVALPMAVKQGTSIGTNVASTAQSAVRRPASTLSLTRGGSATATALRSGSAAAGVAQRVRSRQNSVGPGASPAATTNRQPMASPAARRAKNALRVDTRLASSRQPPDTPVPAMRDARGRSTRRATWPNPDREPASADSLTLAADGIADTPTGAQDGLSDIGAMFTGGATGLVDDVLLRALKVLKLTTDSLQQGRPSP